VHDWVVLWIDVPAHGKSGQQEREKGLAAHNQKVLSKGRKRKAADKDEVICFTKQVLHDLTKLYKKHRCVSLLMTVDVYTR